MALITFQLEHGLKAMGSGDEPLLYREVGLRELTAADLIDAQLDAEKSWCRMAKRWRIPAMCFMA